MDFSFLKEAGVDERRGFTVCPASSFHTLPASLLQTVVVTDIGGPDAMEAVKREFLRRFSGASEVTLWDESQRQARTVPAAALSYPAGGGALCLIFDPEACLRRECGAFSLDRLRRVMEALRAPDGCPWDRAQTHETLRTYLIQEAYEVVDAIDHGDMDNLKEELGDVLYQVVFHARVAEEAGLFSMQDVADGIADKMIGRHPYVFGTMSAEETAELLGTWEVRKMREKRRPHLLSGLSVSLPSLLFACIMQKKVSSICREKAEKAEDLRDRFEFSWRKAMEMAETGSDPAEMERCFGKALFEMAALIRSFGMEPELALHRFNSLYAEQFGKWEDVLSRDGRSTAETDEKDIRRLKDWLREQKLC